MTEQPDLCVHGVLPYDCPACSVAPPPFPRSCCGARYGMPHHEGCPLHAVEQRTEPRFDVAENDPEGLDA